MGTRTSTHRWQEPLEQALARELPRFLPAQRWFGAKARRITGVRAEDTVWLRDGEPPCALVVARVEYARGRPQRYAMLVALRREAMSDASIGPVAAAGERRQLVEVTSHGPDAASLLQHLGQPHDLDAVHGGSLHFDDAPAAGLRRESFDGERIRPLGAEQSNTSLRLGEDYVFKLFRRVEAGENPEVEIGRFLSMRTGFRAAPALRGSMTWRFATGARATVGALQDRVENTGDGWAWALGELEDLFSRRADAEALLAGIRTLGAITAEFHAALASRADLAGFAPAPATRTDALGWAKDLRAHIERAFELLRDRRTDASYPLRASCDRLLALRPSIDALAQPPSTDGAGAFSRIRIHGDYHLGQTLKTHDGFVLIDFEGEPARPLAERRRLHCALKDVAGMCRSFDYAIATARRARADGADVLAATPALRDAFLAGYQRAAAGTAPHLPSSPEAREAWIRFFELDKALYEIEYELQNRPAWLRIPVEGALRLLDAGGVV